MQAASTSFINESFLTLQSGQALCFVILNSFSFFFLFLSIYCVYGQQHAQKDPDFSCYLLIDFKRFNKYETNA